MAKWLKKLFGLAAVAGAAAGVLYYYLKKRSAEDTERSEDAFEDEDFDLDNDLKSASDREYVPLTPGKAESSQEQQPQEETPGEEADKEKSETK